MTPPTEERRAELRAKAEAATPGPWTAEVSIYSDGAFDAHWAVRTVDKLPEHPWSPRFITFMTGTLRSDVQLRDIKGAKYCRECECWHLGWSREIGIDVRADGKARADAEFIAATDPATVIALLDHITALEAALRPFAGDQFEDPSWSNADELVVVEFDGGRLFTLRVGDFRRAASLLPGEGNA